MFAQDFQQGVQQGTLQLVVKLLHKKFDHLPESYQSDLSLLSVSELELLAERIVTASDLKEVFQGFSRESS